jgi:hypothetical protein
MSPIRSIRDRLHNGDVAAVYPCLVLSRGWPLLEMALGGRPWDENGQRIMDNLINRYAQELILFLSDRAMEHFERKDDQFGYLKYCMRCLGGIPAYSVLGKKRPSPCL